MTIAIMYFFPLFKNDYSFILFSIQQAAGVKRLMFCGVGCQVQGIICALILI